MGEQWLCKLHGQPATIYLLYHGHSISLLKMKNKKAISLIIVDAFFTSYQVWSMDHLRQNHLRFRLKCRRFLAPLQIYSTSGGTPDRYIFDNYPGQLCSQALRTTASMLERSL